MTQPHANIPERHELAGVLRALRADSGLSSPQLAGLLGWSQSRVSRIERGITLPKADDVEAWARATNAAPQVRRHLMELAEKAGAQLTEWKRELAPGRRAKQEEMAQLESGASVIRLFGADVVPGLAQTRSYASVMFSLGRHGVTEESDGLVAVLDARMARQSVLADESKRLELLMSEFALRRHLIDVDDRREQLGQLIEISHLPNVHVGVIPFDADEKVHQYHGYGILGDPQLDDNALVLVETLTRGLTIRAAEEVAAYVDHFAQLDDEALHGDELRAFLQEISGATP
jgi:transcriptional regulator with XRE-family HTH domain